MSRQGIHFHGKADCAAADMNDYARRGAPGRKYLPSDLSIARMYRLFEEQTHDEVSLSLYYSVFRSQFNLGFGHPAADTWYFSAFDNEKFTELAEK